MAALGSPNATPVTPGTTALLAPLGSFNNTSGVGSPREASPAPPCPGSPGAGGGRLPDLPNAALGGHAGGHATTASTSATPAPAPAPAPKGRRSLPDLAPLPRRRRAKRGRAAEDGAAAGWHPAVAEHRPAPPAVTSPRAVGAAQHVFNALRDIDLRGLTGRQWVAALVRGYEARLEALEAELLGGCVGNLEAEVLRGELDGERERAERCERSLQAVQQRMLLGGGAGGRPDGDSGPRLAAEVEKLRVQVMELQKKTVAAIRERDAYKTEKMAEEKRCREVEKALATVRKEVLVLQDEVYNARQATEKAEAQCETLRHDLVAAQHELAKAEEKFRQRMQDMQTQLKELKQKYDDHVREAEIAKAAEEARVRKMVKEMNEAFKEKQQALEDEVGRLESELRIAQGELNVAREKIRQLEEIAAGAEAFRERVQDHIGKVDEILLAEGAPSASPRPSAAGLDDGNSPLSMPASPPMSPSASPRSRARQPSAMNLSPEGGGMSPRKSISGVLKQRGMFGKSRVRAQQSAEKAAEWCRRVAKASAKGGVLGSLEDRDVFARMEAMEQGIACLVATLVAVDDSLGNVKEERSRLEAETEEQKRQIRNQKQEAEAEQKRLMEAQLLAEKRYAKIAKRLKELCTGPDPLVDEVTEHEEELKREMKEIEKRLHVAPSVPKQFKRFLNRMNNAGKAAEETWEKKRAEIAEKRRANMERLLDYAGGMGITGDETDFEIRSALAKKPGAGGVLDSPRMLEDPTLSTGMKFKLLVGITHKVDEMRERLRSASPKKGQDLEGRTPTTPTVRPRRTSVSVRQEVAEMMRDIFQRRGVGGVLNTVLAAAADAAGMTEALLHPFVQTWLDDRRPRRTSTDATDLASLTPGVAALSPRHKAPQHIGSTVSGGGLRSQPASPARGRRGDAPTSPPSHPAAPGGPRRDYSQVQPRPLRRGAPGGASGGLGMPSALMDSAPPPQKVDPATALLGPRMGSSAKVGLPRGGRA